MSYTRLTTSDQVNTSNFVLREIPLQIISLIDVRFSNRGIPTTAIIRGIQVGAVKLWLLHNHQDDVAGNSGEQAYLLQPLVDFVMDST